MTVPEAITRRKLTLADDPGLSDDADYEIVDGLLSLSSRARPGHQIVANRCAVLLTPNVENQDPGVVVPDADRIVAERTIYLSPDLMFFAGERFGRIDREDWLRLIPDLIVEVLSLSRSARSCSPISRSTSGSSFARAPSRPLGRRRMGTSVARGVGREGEAASPRRCLAFSPRRG